MSLKTYLCCVVIRQVRFDEEERNSRPLSGDLNFSTMSFTPLYIAFGIGVISSVIGIGGKEAVMFNFLIHMLYLVLMSNCIFILHLLYRVAKIRRYHNFVTVLTPEYAAERGFGDVCHFGTFCVHRNLISEYRKVSC